MTNALKLIKYVPENTGLSTIPWPEGLAPASKHLPLNADGSLPRADVVLLTFTVAEAKAAADVLTPGVHETEWTHYTHRYDEYAPHLTNRSPAKGEKRLASYCAGTVGNLTYLMMKSELHPATDGPALPLATLTTQIIEETGCHTFITTGTAGGAGEGTILGDVNVADKVHADFDTRLKDQGYSHGEWSTTALTPQQSTYLATAEKLFTANSARLPEAPRQPKVLYGVTVSTDFFAFDAENDGYHLRAYEPDIKAVEMDDAAVGYGIVQGVNWYSVRNASDPVMPDISHASDAQAAKIYRKYGYFTTINSAIACWALMAGMAASA